MDDTDGMRTWLRERMRAWEENGRHEGAAPTGEIATVRANGVPAAAAAEPAPVRVPGPPPEASVREHRSIAVGRQEGHPNLLRFPKGQTGNPRGRPVASRDRLGEAFIRDLTAHYAEHGMDAIHRVWAADPTAYLALVARLVPRDDWRPTPRGAASWPASRSPRNFPALSWPGCRTK